MSASTVMCLGMLEGHTTSREMPAPEQNTPQDALSDSASESRSRWRTRLSMIASLQGISEQRWREFEVVYRPLFLFWIRQKNIPSHAVDDVLQDSMISIMQGIGRYESGGRRSFRSWMRTIVQRRAADFFRSSPPEQGGVPELLHEAVSPEQKDPGALAAEEAAMREVHARAMELVRSQTKEQTWKMFWSSTVDGLPTAEVAQEFGVSTAAVRVARQRVKKRLKDVMLEPDRSTAVTPLR